MSMQARIRGGEDWYHPDRDLAHNFHLWLRAAFIRADGLRGLNEAQSTKLVETASRLARLVAACTTGSKDGEGLVRELSSLDPEAMGLVGRELLCHLMAMYREVRLDVLPKVPVQG